MDPILEIAALKKYYGKEPNLTRALNGISFQVMPGEFLGIMGSSGSGKSTLLNCIATVIAPTAGAVALHGKCLTTQQGKALADYRVKEIGYLFQNFELIDNLTGRENILLPLSLHGVSEAESRERLTKLADYLEVTDVLDKFPAQMSGGQKQRIAIARALATNPKVLLCDEATSALDPNTTHAILQLIQKINREMGITVVIITHQMSVVEDVCSHVAILDNGTVVEQGSVRDIFSNPHSDAAKRLVFPAGTPERELLPGRKMVRVAFNGTQTTDKPLVASLAIECGALVSIVAADTRVVNGQTLGSMLLALPEGEGAAKALDYIKNYPGITYEEVGSNG